MRFTKMQGVGNDFIVIDSATLPPDIRLSDLAIQICNRHFGIGADGLIVVSQGEPNAAFRMRMFNPDGTEDMCGNGLRCVGLWAHRAGWLNGETEFAVATKEGVRQARLLEVSDSGCSAMLGVDMGKPRFAPAELPFCAADESRIVGYPLTIDDETYPITVVNTGSTHTIIFCDVQPGEETFQRVSPQMENHPLFPERTSVLWATPIGENCFQVRIWERGAGETLGCGTGACAVGVAAQMENRAGAEVKVVSKGGTLRITWPNANAAIDMVGPAQTVYDGDFTI